MRDAEPGTAPAEVASGRYQIRRRLGEGGRKRVYLAYDTRLDREVALALIKTEGLDDAGILRLSRETQAMGRLGDHPHIVTVYDVGEERGQPYIVSQYLSGGSVEERLHAGAPLRLDDAVRIASQVCAALEHAHAHGIVHRDLKPANVWLAADGTAKLGDFGLALSQDRSRLTVEGMLVGTVAYMAPEQALGTVVDARSDLYALGATLYELATGRPPFVGDDAVAVVSQHLHAAPVAPSWHNPAVSQGLEQLILALLAKPPDQRPASAAVVRETLRGIGAESGALPRRETLRPISITSLAPPPAPSPANPLDRLEGGIFVGRERELAELRAAVEDALSGRGRILLLAGEPGIGKTRTAQELTTYAQLRGMQVLWGRCYEGGGAPAYWPWMQAIRAYVHEQRAEDLLAEMGPGAAVIASLISVVRERLPDLPLPPILDPEQERFRFLDGIISFIRKVASRRALVLVLDDLHSADPSSLLLLRFLAREMSDAPLLVIGTYRDEGVERGQPLYLALAELAREGGRLTLGGLSPTEIGHFIEQTAGHKPADALVSAVSEQTGGNPFFVGEVVRLLTAEGRLTGAEQPSSRSIGVPAAVREVIGRRLDRLSAECNEVLAVAAVAGRTFELELLERVTALPRGKILELLDEAAAARVIAGKPDVSMPYSFAHALIRETIYGDLRNAQRLRLHRQLGEALEGLHAARLAPVLAELAHHFAQASPLGEIDKAVDYTARAGERATALVAYEDAIGHYEHALELLDRQRLPDDARRCEILLALGESQYRLGARESARATFSDAMAMARTLSTPTLLARAALGIAAPFVTRLAYEVGAFDDGMVAALDEALIAVGEGDSTLRARLLSCLASALAWSPAHGGRSAQLALEAVATARRIGDPETLTAALLSRRISLEGPRSGAERLEVEEELVRLAEATGDRQAALAAHDIHRITLLVLGRLEELEGEVALFERLAEESRQPQFQYHARQWQAMRSFLEGRFGDAERLASETLSLGQRIRNQGATQGFGIQMTLLHRERGTFHDIEPAFRGFVERYPTLPWRVGLAVLYSDAGDAEKAEREFESVAADDFLLVRRHAAYTLATACQAAEACSFLCDTRRAEDLYRLLRPHAECFGVLVGAACFGSVSRYLGLLAATMADWEQAEAHFARAVERDARLRAPVWVAHTQYDHAAMLLERSASGDGTKALDLLNAAIQTAHALGMKALLEKALALKLRSQGVDSRDTKTSIDVVASAVEHEQPDLRPHAAPDGTVTILFSDIEGFTAMTERLGDRRAHDVLRSHNRIIREQLKRHAGFEVKSQGDGFMVAFQSARRALLCAIAVQRSLAGHAAEHPEEPIRVRIGLHTGEAIREGGDFFGGAVNLAARIAAAAGGGEILVSSVLKELTGTAGDIRFASARAVELKGLSGLYSLFPVPWSGGDPETADAVPGSVRLQQEGAYWTLVYGGVTARLKDSKGTHYLVRLLRNPGHEMHVLEVAQNGVAGLEGRALGMGTQGLPLLDDAAKAAYRQELADLGAELDEAEQFNDSGRAEVLRTQIEAISQQLAAAVGLGGRDRQAASAAERARSTVTQRIKAAIRKIGERHPSLADHLTRAIKTGTFCSYSPDPARPIEWEL